MRWFYRWYGANPLHLLTLIASFALAGYVAQRLLARDTVAIAIWFAGAVVGHDLLLMPLYSIADRSVLAVFRHDRRPDPPTVSWINYLRVPVVLSGLLLLIWFPLILRLPTRFPILTGLSLDPYLSHWLAVTGVLFLLSAVALAFRLSTRAFTGAGRAERSGRTGRHGLTRETTPPGPSWETGLDQEPGWDPRYERPAPAWDQGYGRPGPPPRDPGYGPPGPAREPGRRPPPGPGWEPGRRQSGPLQEPGRHPTGPQPGRHPTGPQPGRYPTGPQPGRRPTGPQPGRQPTGPQPRDPGRGQPGPPWEPVRRPPAPWEQGQRRPPPPPDPDDWEEPDSFWPPNGGGRGGGTGSWPSG